jgi:hypothetical protein
MISGADFIKWKRDSAGQRIGDCDVRAIGVKHCYEMPGAASQHDPGYRRGGQGIFVEDKFCSVPSSP